MLMGQLVDSQIVLFASIATILVVTPGADTALVIRSTLSRGREAGLYTVYGICLGCIVHASASALGLSIILSQSATAFDIVKMAGACYLVWIGIKSLLASWKGHGGTFQVAPSVEPRPSDLSRSFREGLLTNVLNPKVAIFYLTFLPQFVSPQGSALRQSLLLALIHIAIGFLWLSSYAFFFDKISGIFLRDAVRRKLEAVTGVVLMAMGVRLALEKR